jgi:hypothetical protein
MVARVVSALPVELEATEAAVAWEVLGGRCPVMEVRAVSVVSAVLAAREPTAVPVATAATADKRPHTPWVRQMDSPLPRELLAGVMGVKAAPAGPGGPPEMVVMGAPVAQPRRVPLARPAMGALPGRAVSAVRAVRAVLVAKVLMDLATAAP